MSNSGDLHQMLNQIRRQLKEAQARNKLDPAVDRRLSAALNELTEEYNEILRSLAALEAELRGDGEP